MLIIIIIIIILFFLFLFFFKKKQLTTCNLQGLSILRIAVDTPFIYSRVQRKSVLLFVLFKKDMKENLWFWEIFCFKCYHKKERFYKLNKWEFQMKGNRLKFIWKSGDLPMAWLHRSYKVWKMVNINRRFIEHNNRCSLWQPWIPLFGCFRFRVSLTFHCAPNERRSSRCSYFVFWSLTFA